VHLTIFFGAKIGSRSFLADEVIIGHPCRRGWLRHPQLSNAAMTIRTGTERIVERKMLSRAKTIPAL
jgi:hypothetical protein